MTGYDCLKRSIELPFRAKLVSRSSFVLDHGAGRALLIGEVGSNHNRDMGLAKRLIEVAAEAELDAVKFQAFRAEWLYPPTCGEVETPMGKVDFFTVLEQNQLPTEWLPELKAYAEQCGLHFLCTPFDEQAVSDLYALGVSGLKIASPELNYLPLLRAAAKTGLPLLCSTGISTLADIEEALNTIRAVNPTASVALLQCVSGYPTPPEQSNLAVIETLRRAFGVPVGFSDHTTDANFTPLIAVAAGACLIEKHFTMSRNLPGPDHSFALEPGELKVMTRGIREVESMPPDERLPQMEHCFGTERVRAALGHGRKEIMPIEAELYPCDKRSIHAIRDIAPGEILTPNHIRILRSERNLAPGLHPRHWETLLGAQTVRPLSLGEGVQWIHLIHPPIRDVRPSAEDGASALQGEGETEGALTSIPIAHRGQGKQRPYTVRNPSQSQTEGAASPILGAASSAPTRFATRPSPSEPERVTGRGEMDALTPSPSPKLGRGETETRVGLSTLNSLTKEGREVLPEGQALIRLVQPHITDTDKNYLTERILYNLLDDEEREVEGFEREFAERVGVKEGLAVNSGTSALHLALHALGVGAGDEVILPSYTCVALLHAVHACGATPMLADNACDVRKADFQIRPEEIRKRLTPRTKAILVSQMFGTLLPLHQFDFGVPVLEDFTLSLGAEADGRKAGSLGTIGVCSLHHSKMISCGQGGIVVSNDAKLMARARRFATYDAPMETWRTTSPDLLRGQYEPAASYRMSGLQAALGVSQLRQLDAFIAQRRRIACCYTEAFFEAGLCCPVVPLDGSHSFFRYMISMNRPVVPIIEQLSKQGIQAGRGVYPPLHYLLGLPDADFPGATECVQTLLSVPVHPALSEGDAECIVSYILDALTHSSGRVEG